MQLTISNLVKINICFFVQKLQHVCCNFTAGLLNMFSSKMLSFKASRRKKKERGGNVEFGALQKCADLVELENAVKRIFSCKISF